MNKLFLCIGILIFASVAARAEIEVEPWTLIEPHTINTLIGTGGVVETNLREEVIERCSEKINELRAQGKRVLAQRFKVEYRRLDVPPGAPIWVFCDVAIVSDEN